MLEQGIKNIYENDFKTQEHYLGLICREVRSMRPNILFDLMAFYVPNHDYMSTYFGSEITYSSYDCYDFNGNCKWTGHLVIPIRDIKGNVKGFTGYNPFVTLNKGENAVLNTMSKYKESAKSLMDKSKFGLCPLGLEKAINDGYVIVTDGVFDALNVADCGFNSFCLLGSALTEELQFCLSFIEYIYVASDNDKAGLDLFNTIKRKFPNVIPIRQSMYKDIDEFIKNHREAFIEQVNAIHDKIKLPIFLKC